MIYAYDLTVPADTAQASPASQEMKVTKGVIHQVDVMFPPGCNNAVYVTINQALHQIWPTNPDKQFRGSWVNISFPVWYPYLTEPYVLTAYGWSPGTTYQHIITIRLGIQSLDVLRPNRDVFDTIRAMGKTILRRR